MSRAQLETGRQHYDAISGAHHQLIDNGSAVRPAWGAEAVGHVRHAKLEKLTNEFRVENPRSDLLFIGGRHLAPIEYLNKELRHANASWRVRIENGGIEFREAT